MSVFSDLSLELFAVISTATAGFLTWRWWSNYQKYRSLRCLPSPRGYWLLGIFPKIVATAKAGKLTQLALEWHRNFGDMFVMWIFGKPDLVIGNHQIIQEILLKGQKEGTFVRGGSVYTAYADVFGVHLGNQIGEEWQWRRKAWTPALASSRFQRKFDVIHEASLTLVDKIKQKATKNDAIEVDPLFLDYTMSIIAYFMLGVPLDSEKDPILPILEPKEVSFALAVLEKQVLLQGITGINWLKHLPIEQNQAYRQAQKYLNDFLHPRIDLAFKVARNQELSQNELSRLTEAFQDSMVVQMASAPKYEPKHLINDIRAGLFAGHDTTSHTLSFAMGELGLNPRVVDKARSLIDPVMENGLSVESLKDLVYVEAIFRETMRLHPVAPQFSVVTTCDTSIKEVRIPADTKLSLNIMTAGRDPDLHPQPLEFRPERWLKAEENNGNEAPILLGFSLGPHYCLGAPLAILEATVILSLLIYHFDWDLVNGRASLEELDQNMTVFARDRMPVKFQVRQFAQQSVNAR